MNNQSKNKQKLQLRKIARGPAFILRYGARYVKEVLKVHIFSRHISNKRLLRFLCASSTSGVVQYYRRQAEFKFLDFPAGDAVKTIAIADKLCEHVFDILGSGPVSLGRKINWHCDFKSGYCWDAKLPFTKIKYGSHPGADVKIPWELSRCQHLTLLGRAYVLTKDDKYASEITQEITDWIADNTAGRGVNWKCTMDVAIRACNWICAFELIKSSATISDEFILSILRSLMEHGRHIAINLEGRSGGVNSNHYLSDIVGLIYLGVFFKHTRLGKKWLAFGLRELEREIQTQVSDDGTDFESSIPYHRLVLELFGYSALLCKANGLALSERFFIKLRRMLDFVACYLKPNGQAPQIGDNDNGRLHKFQSDDFDEKIMNDHRYLFKLAKQIFPDYVLPTPASRAFNDGGYFIMRDASNYLIACAGKVGTSGIGNHKHNDVLSFELQVNGEDIIVDPGTYAYTPDHEMRNLFRSSAYHNTVTVDSVEINEMRTGELFKLYERANPKVLTWQANEQRSVFEAEHYGYRRLADPVTHCRRYAVDKKDCRWIIDDEISGHKVHQLALFIHLAPNIALLSHNSRQVVLKTPGRQLINITFSAPDEWQLHILRGWTSASYGLKEASTIIKLSGLSELPLKLRTEIFL